MNDPAYEIDLGSPRTVGQILDVALRIYGRRPLLFVLLAAIVLVPYGAVRVIVANEKHVSSTTDFLLLLAELALVNPFVSALQVQALLDLGTGRQPRLPDLIRRGLKVLAVVAAADIIAGVAEVVGLLCFVIPGLIAAIRLAVVAPAAAAEDISWPEALGRSFTLTRGSSWRVLGVLLIQAVLLYLVEAIIGARATGVEVFGAALLIVGQSFCTLLINLLYFDLRARQTAPVAWR